MRDRRNQTILQGIPLSWYRLINLKTFVAFSYTMLVLFALFIAGMAVLTIPKWFRLFWYRNTYARSGRCYRFMDYGNDFDREIPITSNGFHPDSCVLVYSLKYGVKFIVEKRMACPSRLVLSFFFLNAYTLQEIKGNSRH